MQQLSIDTSNKANTKGPVSPIMRDSNPYLTIPSVYSGSNVKMDTGNVRSELLDTANKLLTMYLKEPVSPKILLGVNQLLSAALDIQSDQVIANNQILKTETEIDDDFIYQASDLAVDDANIDDYKINLTNGWYRSVCQVLNLLPKDINDQYILSINRSPNAVDLIENQIFRTNNTVYRRDIGKNVFTVPFKKYICGLLRNVFQRLNDYIIDGTGKSESSLVDVVFNNRIFRLPLVRSYGAKSGLVILPLCLSRNIKTMKWLSVSPSRANIPIPDASEKVLCQMLFVNRCQCRIIYEGNTFYVPTNLKSDVCGKIQIVHRLVKVTRADPTKIWDLEALPFEPYQGEMIRVSLNSWLFNPTFCNLLDEDIMIPMLEENINRTHHLLSTKIKNANLKLGFKLTSIYDYTGIQFDDDRSELKDVTDLIMDLSNTESHDDMLLINASEYFLSINQVTSREARIRYDNSDYRISLDDIKIIKNDGKLMRIARLSDDLYVVWNDGQWTVNQNDYSDSERIWQDYIDIPFIMIWNIPPLNIKYGPSFDNVDRNSSTNNQSLDITLNNRKLYNSLFNCQGIITFSKYISDWLSDKFSPNIPITNFTLPVSPPRSRFSYNDFISNPEKSLVQMGFSGSRMCFIGTIQTSLYKKLWLCENADIMKLLVAESKFHSTTAQICSDMSDVTLLTTINDEIYDIVLSNNIVVVKFEDVGASNILVKSIIRHTPILVNRHPAVIEYLGQGYPLYYDTLDEAINKVHDMDILKRAYVYLRDGQYDSRLSTMRLKEQLTNSDVISRKIPSDNQVLATNYKFIAYNNFSGGQLISSTSPSTVDTNNTSVSINIG
jgi:hypothetical protein